MKKFSHSIKSISISKLLNYHHHNNHNNDNQWINGYNFYSTYASSKTVRLKKSGDKNVICDFRSDTVTTPTLEMFNIMNKASGGDDIFKDESTNDLENFMADLTGHQAALFAVSGTMTNQIAIRTHLAQPPHSILCDARSHLHNYELGGVAYHSQATTIPITPKNQIYLTAIDDLQPKIIKDDVYDVFSTPTKLISLENTLDGLVMPIEEIIQISKLSRSTSIKTHLDGARLWNASAATGIPIQDYCKYFDSVSLCLSKGIGAPIGSVLVGNQNFIDRARLFRRLFGGAWHQSGSLAAAAKYAIMTNFPNAIVHSHELTNQLEKGLRHYGITITKPVHTNMIFIDTKSINITIKQLAEPLLKYGILISDDGLYSTRLVLNYQITKNAIDTFLKVVNDVIVGK
ncbi:14429_t:CDS:2 [Entrophospora sp. SA101]|nr:2735_t:CDS:2 [Entrophospora sp. SA101]CAJ0629909.1 9590_t:CDS:2 [Entrophospora sp. SA101]CAJ0639916.1 14718_t:CDS:2 [Entrophospora sp. SA101]CAJ0765824.1 14429_t:CDS:2 [Entrophospora sp. SA101]CAJ0823312.1 3885_t:CDS:2 [Entrophospora sp. SA101]